MSSFLEIYLKRKKKEGEEKEERLLFSSISRGTTLYELFYENKPGIPSEQCIYEFTSKDLRPISDELDTAIARSIVSIMDLKDNIRLIAGKDTIEDLLDRLRVEKEYLDELKQQKAMIDTLYVLFMDIDEDWCDFNKLYWKIT